MLSSHPFSSTGSGWYHQRCFCYDCQMPMYHMLARAWACLPVMPHSARAPTLALSLSSPAMARAGALRMQTACWWCTCLRLTALQTPSTPMLISPLQQSVQSWFPNDYLLLLPGLPHSFVSSWQSKHKAFSLESYLNPRTILRHSLILDHKTK